MKEMCGEINLIERNEDEKKGKEKKRIVEKNKKEKGKVRKDLRIENREGWEFMIGNENINKLEDI